MPTKKGERITERDHVLLKCGHISFGYGMLKILGKIGTLYTDCPKGCEGNGPDGLVEIQRKAKPGDYNSAIGRPDNQPSNSLF